MKKHIFLFLLFVLSQSLSAQVATQGTDFYVSFGVASDKPGTFQIKIVTSVATTVTFTYTDTGVSNSVTLDAGTVHTESIIDANVYSASTGTTSKTLRIQSTQPVSAYALNQASATADATNVLPVSNWGTDYYHISYQAALSNSDGYAVIAATDGTKISEGGTQVATLSAGQVYHKFYTAAADGTGAHITSTTPVAFFVVNKGAQIPNGTVYIDRIFQQMAPVNSWGNNFLVPVSKRGRERIRVVASQNGTTITQSGGTIQAGLGVASLNLDAGQFVELETTLAGGGCYISANKPVGVCAYMLGTGYADLSYAPGDPALAWVPPVEQTVAGTVIAPFVPSGTTQLTEHYALVVTATATRDQTTVAIGTAAPDDLNGGSWTTGSGAGSAYSFYSMELTDKDSSYYFYNPNGLTVMGYGLGSAESYYYLSGAAARNLIAAFYINNIHYQDIDGEVFCGQQTFAVRAVVQYAMSTTPGYLKWYINGAEELAARDVSQWNKTLAPGTYLVEMVVLDMYNVPHTESATLTVRAQASATGITAAGTAVCPNTAATLTASSSGVTGPVYRWYASQTAAEPLHTGPVFTTPALTVATTYYVSVEGSNYCENAANDRRAVTVSVSPCVVPVNPHLRSRVVGH